MERQGWRTVPDSVVYSSLPLSFSGLGEGGGEGSLGGDMSVSSSSSIQPDGAGGSTFIHEVGRVGVLGSGSSSTLTLFEECTSRGEQGVVPNNKDEAVSPRITSC